MSNHLSTAYKHSRPTYTVGYTASATYEYTHYESGHEALSTYLLSYVVMDKQPVNTSAHCRLDATSEPLKYTKRGASSDIVSSPNSTVSIPVKYGVVEF